MDKDYALSMANFNEFNTYVNAALDNDEITKDEWYEIVNLHTTKWYLSYDNPRAQSGHGGDEYHYRFSHLPIIECLYKDGTFLDVGCANGHLMEMVHKWANAIGFDLQVFGVDISEGLIELAKKRLPQWYDNFYIANRYFWKSEIKFDYIHLMGIGGYPEYDERICFEYYMENYLADGGRMIIGPYWYENEDT
ncbi:MAG: class I SAM-dependent methyltransferase [Oscillospiraceae bacterium]|nr:class I SAM-dependent methyltransferase [Oscillospiraceae bacterium]